MFTKSKSIHCNSHSYALSKFGKTVKHFTSYNHFPSSELTRDIKISEEIKLTGLQEKQYVIHLRKEGVWTKPLARLNKIGNGLYFTSIIKSGLKTLLILSFDPFLHFLTVREYPGFYPCSNSQLLQLLSK
jgi:hypothetical protein